MRSSSSHKTFGVIANPEKFAIAKSLTKIAEWCLKSGQRLHISPKLQPLLIHPNTSTTILDSELDVLNSSDIILSIGGDGTMLWTSQLMIKAEKSKPILGVNSGKLGFMANTSFDSIESTLDDVINSNYKLEKRFFLEAKHPSFGKKYALNEFLFSKKDSSTMITVDAKYNNQLINRYWADGLLVATPTGSTAYNLSSGGPIVLPTTEIIIITPINPHTLTTRPLVLPVKGKLEICIDKQKTEGLFSYDGINVEIESYPFSVEIQQSERFIEVIELEDYSYFSTLRNKLMWGRDSRDH